MNADLQGKLAEILTSIQQATGAARDFAIEQLPDVAQSYILYGRARSVAEVVALLILIIAAVLWFRWGWKHRADSGDASFAACMFGGFASVTCTGFLFIAANDALRVWIAPKVWLLQELAKLVK